MNIANVSTNVRNVRKIILCLIPKLINHKKKVVNVLSIMSVCNVCYACNVCDLWMLFNLTVWLLSFF